MSSGELRSRGLRELWSGDYFKVISGSGVLAGCPGDRRGASEARVVGRLFWDLDCSADAPLRSGELPSRELLGMYSGIWGLRGGLAGELRGALEPPPSHTSPRCKVVSAPCRGVGECGGEGSQAGPTPGAEGAQRLEKFRVKSFFEEA